MKPTVCTCTAYHREHGKHAKHCPYYVEDATPWTFAQYRAVFSYPSSILGKTPDTYGPWRHTLQEAVQDRVPRSEETHGWRSGVERRLVTHPVPFKVYVELDALPLLGVTTDEGERESLAALHGVWFDRDALREAKPGDPVSAYTTQPSGRIVYREDGAPAEVYTMRKDWSKR